jgi:hypothetical protein
VDKLATSGVVKINTVESLEDLKELMKQQN